MRHWFKTLKDAKRAQQARKDATQMDIRIFRRKGKGIFFVGTGWEWLNQ